MSHHDFDETTSALGDLVIAFQMLENSLLGVFGRLATPQEVTPGIIIGSQISFRNLVLLTDALCRYRTQDTALLAELDEITKIASLHEGTRNRFLHSHYDMIEVVHDKVKIERIKRTVRLRKGFVPNYESYDPEKVHAFATEMITLSQRIDAFLERLVTQGVVPSNESN